MIGKKVSATILGGKELAFYQWAGSGDGKPQPLLDGCREKIDALAAQVRDWKTTPTEQSNKSTLCLSCLLIALRPANPSSSLQTSRRIYSNGDSIRVQVADLFFTRTFLNLQPSLFFWFACSYFSSPEFLFLAV
jgi:hypothetical protein